ncbi:MAG: hypothetical protein Kow0069_37320 [Promethearchaeota archaeon]
MVILDASILFAPVEGGLDLFEAIRDALAGPVQFVVTWETVVELERKAAKRPNGRFGRKFVLVKRYLTERGIWPTRAGEISGSPGDRGQPLPAGGPRKDGGLPFRFDRGDEPVDEYLVSLASEWKRRRPNDRVFLATSDSAMAAEARAAGVPRLRLRGRGRAVKVQVFQ